MYTAPYLPFTLFDAASGNGNPFVIRPSQGLYVFVSARSGLREGNSFAEEELILKQLFAVGATIQEINTIRKHISMARGGWLAKYTYPARSVAFT